MSKFSDLTNWSNVIRPQPMFDVLASANHQESLGNYVARMEIGDTTGFRNEFIHQLVSEEARKEFRYAPSSGDKSLISAVMKSQWDRFDFSTHAVSIAPANFLITAALAAITKPGDLVLLPNPGFPTYKLSSDFLRLRVIYYDVEENVGPVFDFDKFLEQYKEFPKVAIVNNPSNPLGIAFPKEKFTNFLELLDLNNIEVIHDETYINLIYDNTNVEVMNQKGIRIRTFSKEHCAPGLRIGYSIAKLEQSQVINDFISLTISCAPEFIQKAIARYLLGDESKAFLSKVKAEMLRRFNFLADTLPERVFITKPNAAFYAFLEVGNGDKAFNALINQNVASCPGSKFGSAGNSKIRVSLAGSGTTFEKDVEMLNVGLRKFLN